MAKGLADMSLDDVLGALMLPPTALDRLAVAEVQIKTALAALTDGEYRVARMLMDDALLHVREARK